LNDVEPTAASIVVSSRSLRSATTSRMQRATIVLDPASTTRNLAQCGNPPRDRPTMANTSQAITSGVA
jgi:hypothetical protein